MSKWTQHPSDRVEKLGKGRKAVLIVWALLGVFLLILALALVF